MITLHSRIIFFGSSSTCFLLEASFLVNSAKNIEQVGPGKKEKVKASHTVCRHNESEDQYHLFAIDDREKPFKCNEKNFYSFNFFYFKERMGSKIVTMCSLLLKRIAAA